MELLPAGFETLEPFIDHWAVTGESKRATARSDASRKTQAAFYDAAFNLMMPALAYLDQRPIAQLDEKDTRLLQLMLSLANVYHSIEVLGDGEADSARRRAVLRFIDHAPY